MQRVRNITPKEDDLFANLMVVVVNLVIVYTYKLTSLCTGTAAGPGWVMSYCLFS